MDDLDLDALSRDLVRALRGERSQTALSRRLGYTSNAVHNWESGRRAPAAYELFRIIERTGGDPVAAFARFPFDLDGAALTTPEGITTLLSMLRGSTRVGDLAARCGASRFTVSRWLSGRTSPRLPQLLALIEVCTLRLVDFVAAIVDPASIPQIAGPWRELQARRNVAFSHPWSQALLRVFETRAYRRRPHSDRWLADRLGVPVPEVVAARDVLAEVGLVRFERGRYVADEAVLDTTVATPEERKKLKLHWADAGRRALEEGREGLFSWAVFTLSEEDYRTLQQLHVAYMQRLYRLVGASAPAEVVALANVQLFALSGAD